jgi:uncharacterized membrane protein
MKTGRLEAFSDGVLAIIITIMVLEMKVPHGNDFASLKPLIPVFISYLLSFIYLGIYWNNHHHLLHTVKQVTAGVLWGNLHLLFWLSLIPFVTGWMGENHFSPIPVAVYGFVLLMSAMAWWILQTQILKRHGLDSALAKAIGNDFKGKLSNFIYLIAIFSCIYNQWIACALYVLVALIWVIPDKRIERVFNLENEISTD